MIKNEIINIHNTIVGLNLIQRWGGYSAHKTDSDNGIPYGVSKMKDCYGNTYTYDDRVETVGYLSLNPFTTTTENRMFVRMNISFVVHLFNNTRKQGEDQRFYQKAILILKELKKKFDDVNLSSIDLRQDKIEYTTITITQNYIIPCDYDYEELNELCDGDGLIDVCEPIDIKPIFKNMTTFVAQGGGLPENARKGDTVVQEIENGLEFYTYNGTEWVLNWLSEGGGLNTDESIEISGSFGQNIGFPPSGVRGYTLYKNKEGLQWRFVYQITANAEEIRLEPANQETIDFLQDKKGLCLTLYDENQTTKITTSLNPMTWTNRWYDGSILNYHFFYTRLTIAQTFRNVYFSVKIYP
jgi:hypothetical protein